MNEMKKHRQDSLREILLLERKRYCDVVAMLNNIIDSQIHTCQNTAQVLQGQQQKWKDVAAAESNLSSDSHALLNRTGVKERTSTAIQGGELSGGGSGYDEGYDGGYDEGYYEEGYGAYDEGYYEEGYEEGYYEEGGYDEYSGGGGTYGGGASSSSYSSGGYGGGYGGGAPSSGGYGGGAPSSGGYGGGSAPRAPPPAVPPASKGFRARALYDYVGTHDYELSFYAGDVITVTQEDAATGWWTGELNGVVGPFPGNYVERV